MFVFYWQMLSVCNIHNMPIVRQPFICCCFSICQRTLFMKFGFSCFSFRFKKLGTTTHTLQEIAQITAFFANNFFIEPLFLTCPENDKTILFFIHNILSRDF